MTDHQPGRRVSLPSAEAVRTLRRRSTAAEAVLWTALRNRKLSGLKFRRQRPLGPFVVDFICREARLVVEVKGPVHDEQADQDAYRSDLITSYGFRVLRIRNDEVMTDLPTVLTRIAAADAKTPPLPRKGEGWPEGPG